MMQPGRKYSAGSKYRYGFNGKENDNEVKGEGNQQDYGMRIYDTRLGRFLSADPLSKEYPWNSTYSYSEDDPINYEDIDGMEKGSTPAAARRVVDRSALKPNPSPKSNSRVDKNGNIITGPISPSNPPSTAPYEGATREAGGYNVYPASGGVVFIPDQNPHGPQPLLKPVDLRTTQEKQVDAGERELFYIKRDLNADRPTPLVLPDIKNVPVKSPTTEKTNTNNDKPKQYLIRRGADPESADKLAADASKAEKVPKFGHGVSTTIKNRVSGTDKKDRSALLTDVAKVFTVIPTPTANNPNHVTVILPKPVTKEVEIKFNALFKPKQ